MEREIPLFEIAWDGDDVKNVVDSVTRGGYWAKGPYVDEFETRLEAYFDAEHATVLNSGTSALEAALEGHRIGPGDEVIVPSFTFIATANAVKSVGATPVFADIERETFGLDPRSVEEKVSEDTAAVLPVHCYGSPCKIREIREVADERGLVVIEDAAEAFGATVDGRKVGTFGDATALSFCQNKVVPTGEGGAVVTDDAEVAREIERYRSHGRVPGDYFESSDSGQYVSHGRNLRMADAVASIGCAQMEKKEELIRKRRQVASSYEEELRGISGVTPFRGAEDGDNVYQLFTVVFDPEVNRANVIETLDEHGVASKIYWDPPVHATEYYRNAVDSGPLPVTEDVASRVLSLPMFPGLTHGDVEHVADGIQRAIE